MKYDIGLDIGVASTGLAVVNEEGKVLESVASLYNEADAASNVDRRDFRVVEEQKEENILELKILGNYGINTVM